MRKIYQMKRRSASVMRLVLLFVCLWCSVGAWADAPYYKIIGGLLFCLDRDTRTGYVTNNNGSLGSNYKGDIIIPDSVEDNGIYYKVTKIGDNAFENCYGLTSITIPNSVTEIGSCSFKGCKAIESFAVPDSIRSIESETFSGCKKLSSVTLPDGVVRIGNNAFYNCSSLEIINIPKSVESIGASALADCAKLKSIIVPNSVKQIGEEAFGEKDRYSIYCYPVPYHILWFTLRTTYGGRAHLCGGPIYYIYEIERRTQTTITINFRRIDPVTIPDVEEINVKDYRVSVPDGKVNSENCSYIYGLKPHKAYTISLYTTYDDGSETCQQKEGGTSSLGWVSGKKISPTSAKFQDVFKIDTGDAGKIKEAIAIINQDTISKNMNNCCTGLTPNQKYYVSCYVELENGYKDYYSGEVNTQPLELTTQTPKGVSSTCSIVAATTNISEDEPNVGFEWRKYDAPSTLKSSEGYAAIYNGQLEGYIKNLQPTSYYNVRPFYKSADDKYYYGEWVTFDPSDFSFFEPTVHTYAATTTTETSATISGYALAGTDNILEQGFEYWMHGSMNKMPMRVSATTTNDESKDNVMTAITTGQRMQVVLEGLKPGTTYTYRAYVRTASGTTYGEEQTFTTNVATGIENVGTNDEMPTVEGYYDMSGRKLQDKQKGINIVRYSNGATRKIIVR